MTQSLARFGVLGTFTVQYFGVAFLLIGAAVGLLPASQIGRAADEETSGRLLHVLVGPTTRGEWLMGRLAVAAGGTAIAGVWAGVGVWTGAASQGVQIRFQSLVGAGLNVIPLALVALGVGAVVFAVAPRLAGRSIYLLVAWSLIADLVASMVSGLSWIGRTSLFHYLKLVPAQPADLRSSALAVTAAVALGAVAMSCFTRRDLRAA